MTSTSVCPSAVCRPPQSAVLRRPCVRKLAPFPAVVLQNVTNKSCLVCVMSEKYAFWVTLRPQSDRCCRGEAEVRIIDFKTTWSEFQKASQTATEQGKAKLLILDFKTTLSEFQRPSQTALAEAKPRCIYSILKPHGQSSRCQVRLLLPRRSRGAYIQF